MLYLPYVCTWSVSAYPGDKWLFELHLLNRERRGVQGRGGQRRGDEKVTCREAEKGKEKRKGSRKRIPA